MGSRWSEDSFAIRAVLASLVCCALTAASLMAPAAPRASAAPPSLAWQTCDSGEPADQQCDIPRGVAADPDTGHIFVGDSNNLRVSEFDIWGQFVKAWGWDVVASGPGDSGTGFEICVPANGDTCKAGSEGSGPGQFRSLQGMAVDSAGNVYVADSPNRRVQKFSPAGEFLLMFGGGVNQGPSNPGNVCTAADLGVGDVCGAGATGPAPNPPGQFGTWRVGSFIAITPSDQVFVGDEQRIQRFDTNGVYKGEIPLPGETVQSLASDSSGNLYVTYYDSGIDSKANVHKIDTTGAPVPPTTFLVPNPRAIAVDPDGNVFVFDKSNTEILQFDDAAALQEKFAEDLDGGSTGIAAGTACGLLSAQIYATNSVLKPAFLRAYGPNPDPSLCPPPKAAPDITAQYAVSADDDSAILRAEINPRFWGDVSYFVEYGTTSCASGGCSTRVPVGMDAELGGEPVNEPVPTANLALSGLQPQTTYYFRFVASSGGGGPVRGVGGVEGVDGSVGQFTTAPFLAQPKTDCPNQAFRVGASRFLPDCRAYEMVSPTDKNGGGAETLINFSGAEVRAKLDQSAADGDGFTYSAKTAFGDAVSAPFTSQHLASRDPVEGWTSHAISPPREGYAGSQRQALDAEFKVFSDDLAQGWLLHDADPPLAACAPVDSPKFYRRDNLTDQYEALHCEPLEPQLGNLPNELQGVSSDGCHAIFRSRSKLTSDAVEPDPSKSAQNFQLYESNCDDGLRLVSVLPGGAGPCEQESTAGSATGGFNDGRSNKVWGAFSSDATGLYWTCGTTLYYRSDPDPGSSGDEQVSVVAAPVLGASPVFQAAASDGSKALFTGLAAPAFTNALQVFDAQTKTSAVVATGLEGPTGQRLGLLGASHDASRAYFVSTEVLSGGQENSQGDKATGGQSNLYLYDAADGITYVATLADADLNNFGSTPSSIHPLPYRRISRVSPDGLRVAFVSTAPLTGFDNTDADSGEADGQVFLFDATVGSGQLVCVSCNPTGARPNGRNIGGETEGRRLWVAAKLPGWETQLYASRALSDDGSRLFFESFDPLVSRDTNNVQDVYEWERAASESECLDEKGAELFVEEASGCISLVSSGQGDEDTEFVDADRDGSDVFIRTAESLLPGIDSGHIDIYDARVGGGFPLPTTAPRVECEGSSCQSPPPAPVFQTPATTSPSSGNVTPQRPKARRCPRGKRRVIRQGKRRCVKKRKGHSRRRSSSEPRRAAK